MIDDNSTTDLKKDKLTLASAASDVQGGIISEVKVDLGIRPKNIHLLFTSSSNLISSDPSPAKPDSHSEAFKTSTVANRYKITLAQARRMALNSAKRAQRRRDRALEDESDLEV